eukprot:4374961-Pleurochrysis_carterae.AAC.2
MNVVQEAQSVIKWLKSGSERLKKASTAQALSCAAHIDVWHRRQGQRREQAKRTPLHHCGERHKCTRTS